MKVSIHSRDDFEKNVFPKYKEDLEDSFYISILDPIEGQIAEDSSIFKTLRVLDIDTNVGGYIAFTEQQAKEIYRFIMSNYGKKLYVHCHAGVSRSSAIAEFYFEMLGGSYKELTKVYKHIMPNSRILHYLRVQDSLEKNKEIYDELKSNFK